MGHLTRYCNLISEKLHADGDKVDPTNSVVINQLFKGKLMERFSS